MTSKMMSRIANTLNPVCHIQNNFLSFSPSLDSLCKKKSLLNHLKVEIIYPIPILMIVFFVKSRLNFSISNNPSDLKKYVHIRFLWNKVNLLLFECEIHFKMKSPLLNELLEKSDIHCSFVDRAIGFVHNRKTE